MQQLVIVLLVLFYSVLIKNMTWKIIVMIDNTALGPEELPGHGIDSSHSDFDEGVTLETENVLDDDTALHDSSSEDSTNGGFTHHIHTLLCVRVWTLQLD